MKHLIMSLAILVLVACGGARESEPGAKPGTVTVQLVTATLKDATSGPWTVTLVGPDGAVSATCTDLSCAPALSLDVAPSDLESGQVFCHLDIVEWAPDANADFVLQPAAPLAGQHVDEHRAVDFVYEVE